MRILSRVAHFRIAGWRKRQISTRSGRFGHGNTGPAWLAPKAGVAVKMKRSYLDTLNAGRQRRPDASLDDLNRALDGFGTPNLKALRAGRACAANPRALLKSPAPHRCSVMPNRSIESRQHPSPSRSLHALARDIDRARHQEDVVGSVAQIAADLTQLREEFRNEIDRSARTASLKPCALTSKIFMNLPAMRRTIRRWFVNSTASAVPWPISPPAAMTAEWRSSFRA